MAIAECEPRAACAGGACCRQRRGRLFSIAEPGSGCYGQADARIPGARRQYCNFCGSKRRRRGHHGWRRRTTDRGLAPAGSHRCLALSLSFSGSPGGQEQSRRHRGRNLARRSSAHEFVVEGGWELGERSRQPRRLHDRGTGGLAAWLISGSKRQDNLCRARSDAPSRRDRHGGEFRG